MIHPPKHSMIGMQSITKPRILPPKRKADILPRLMEFQRLIADGMTADAAMRMIEGRDGQKAKLPPDEPFRDTRAKPKKIREKLVSIDRSEEVAEAMTGDWVSCLEIAKTIGAARSSVWGAMQCLVRSGRAEASPKKGNDAIKYRLTAPQASGAIRTSKTGQTPSGGAPIARGGQMEGRS